MAEDAPPPYSEVDPNGAGTQLDQHVSVTTPASQSSHSRPNPTPPARPGKTSAQRPPAQRPQASRPQNLPSRPPQHPQSSHSSPYSHSSSQHAAPHRPPPQHQMHRPRPQPRPQTQLAYPNGYYCPECHNSGVKPSGNSCKDCWSRFGPRNTNIQYVPHYAATPLGRVVHPGDPSIGGILCGRCRGSGVTHELLLFEETCRVCGGIGRIIR